jgi:hypothetical protein
MTPAGKDAYETCRYRNGDEKRVPPKWRKTKSCAPGSKSGNGPSQGPKTSPTKVVGTHGGDCMHLLESLHSIEGR